MCSWERKDVFSILNDLSTSKSTHIHEHNTTSQIANLRFWTSVVTDIITMVKMWIVNYPMEFSTRVLNKLSKVLHTPNSSEVIISLWIASCRYSTWLSWRWKLWKKIAKLHHLIYSINCTEVITRNVDPNSCATEGWIGNSKSDECNTWIMPIILYLVHLNKEQ